MNMKQKRKLSILTKFTMLIVVFIISNIVYTQILAHQFNYQKILGNPLYDKLYNPIKWIDWIKWKNDFPEIFKIAFNISLIVFCLLFLIICIIVMLKERSATAIEGLHGTAYWAKKEDIVKAELMRESGVYVGAWTDEKGKIFYLRHDGPEHIIAFAPTRSGKGVGLVIPTLLSWTESVLVYDIKGENHALTGGWRHEYAKNKILKFDPSNPDDSCSFNALAEIRFDDERAISDTQNIATILVDPQGKGLESHWDKTAFSLLVGVILFTIHEVKEKENRIANLTDVALMLSNPAKPIVDVFNDMLGNQIKNNHVKIVVASEARSMLNKAEEEMSSIVSTALANLSLYKDPIISKNTSKSDFKVHDLMNSDKPISLYIVDRPSDSERIRPLIRLMIVQIIRGLTEKMEFKDGRSVKHYKHRLLLMLDEFPSLKKLTIIEDGLAFMAGYGIKAYLICQDIQQINSVYTKDEKIIANCHIRIGYAPTKLETAEVLSKMSGISTVIKEEISISGTRLGGIAKSFNKSYREHQRPLITADEVLRLKKPLKNKDDLIVQAGELLIFTAGHAPIKGTQILYFNDEVFLARAKVSLPEQTYVTEQKQTPTEFNLD